uniref:ENPP1-3/EXOG-like endonuclease/phosphodiesterase domain-containing protein n=1 Tax=Strigamia maritima TaxID=126957 RepID=T1IKU1_STRMM
MQLNTGFKVNAHPEPDQDATAAAESEIYNQLLYGLPSDFSLDTSCIPRTITSTYIEDPSSSFTSPSNTPNRTYTTRRTSTPFSAHVTSPLVISSGSVEETLLDPIEVSDDRTYFPEPDLSVNASCIPGDNKTRSIREEEKSVSFVSPCNICDPNIQRLTSTPITAHQAELDVPTSPINVDTSSDSSTGGPKKRSENSSPIVGCKSDPSFDTSPSPKTPKSGAFGATSSPYVCKYGALNVTTFSPFENRSDTMSSPVGSDGSSDFNLSTSPIESSDYSESFNNKSTSSPSYDADISGNSSESFSPVDQSGKLRISLSSSKDDDSSDLSVTPTDRLMGPYTADTSFILSRDESREFRVRSFHLGDTRSLSTSPTEVESSKLRSLQVEEAESSEQSDLGAATGGPRTNASVYSPVAQRQHRPVVCNIPSFHLGDTSDESTLNPYDQIGAALHHSADRAALHYSADGAALHHSAGRAALQDTLSFDEGSSSSSGIEERTLPVSVISSSEHRSSSTESPEVDFSELYSPCASECLSPSPSGLREGGIVLTPHPEAGLRDNLSSDGANQDVPENPYKIINWKGQRVCIPKEFAEDQATSSSSFMDPDPGPAKERSFAPVKEHDIKWAPFCECKRDNKHFPNVADVEGYDFSVCRNYETGVPNWTLQHLECRVKEDCSCSYCKTVRCPGVAQGEDEEGIPAEINEYCDLDLDPCVFQALPPQATRKELQNNSLWDDFYHYVLYLADKYERIYVCSIPGFIKPQCGPDRDIYPTHFYKVILTKEKCGTYQFECYRFENQQIAIRHPELLDYRVLKGRVEQETGIKFFSLISRAMIGTKKPHYFGFIPHRECPKCFPTIKPTS